MAHFMAEIQGGRGEASRLGSKKSGIDARVSGWESGVKVEGRNDGDGDVFDVFMTRGSSPRGGHIFVGRVVMQDGCPTFIGGDSLEVDGKETDAWIGAQMIG